MDNMISCLKLKKSGLPYGLFLSQVFKFYGIKLEARNKVEATEFFDIANLTQSHLEVLADGTLVRILPTITVVMSPSSQLESEAAIGLAIHNHDLLNSLRDDTGVNIMNLVDLSREMAELKKMFLASQPAAKTTSTAPKPSTDQESSIACDTEIAEVSAVEKTPSKKD